MLSRVFPVLEKIKVENQFNWGCGDKNGDCGDGDGDGDGGDVDGGDGDSGDGGDGADGGDGDGDHNLCSHRILLSQTVSST